MICAFSITIIILLLDSSIKWKKINVKVFSPICKIIYIIPILKKFSNTLDMYSEKLSFVSLIILYTPNMIIPDKYAPIISKNRVDNSIFSLKTDMQYRLGYQNKRR